MLRSLVGGKSRLAAPEQQTGVVEMDDARRLCSASTSKFFFKRRGLTLLLWERTSERERVKEEVVVACLDGAPRCSGALLAALASFWGGSGLKRGVRKKGRGENERKKACYARNGKARTSHTRLWQEQLRVTYVCYVCIYVYTHVCM